MYQCLEVPRKYKNGLYHRDVYLPKEITDRLPDEIREIVYTDHALLNSVERDICLPEKVLGGSIFEVEIKNHRIVKACYSFRHFRNTNLCMVFYTYPTRMICGTCWLNDKSQKKFKLNRDRYIGEPNV